MGSNSGAAEDVSAAFAFLDNDVRLAILESLYDRTVVAGPMTESATYSAIREDAGVADSGRFSYHLDKLTDWFVTKTDDGYQLREPGRKVVMLRRTGVLTNGPTVEPRPVDAACYRCGSTVQVGYRHGHLITVCPDCPGLFTRELLPSGTLTALTYPPSGIEDAETIDIAFERAHRRVGRILSMMDDGFCPRCGGSVTATLDPCRDHAVHEDGLCDACGLWHPAFVRFACDVCGQQRITHPLHAAADRPPVADRLDDLGVGDGWDQFAELMRWPVTVRDDEVVFTPPDGDRLTVRARSGLVVE